MASARVTLASGTLVKLNTANAKLDDHTRRRVLVASVMSGEMIVKLQPGSGAYVQARGSAFAAGAALTSVWEHMRASGG